MARLNAKQKIFVAEFLKDRNATRSAKAAGYSKKTARTIGSKLLTNVAVRKAIEAGLNRVVAKTEITAERVLNRIAKFAFDSDWEKTSDILKANELLGKHLDIFKDGGPPININNVVPATQEQIDAAVEKARNKV